ncbi:MAG: hypothetical protein J5693_03120 [Bacteroidales bacterium]|nr:hypothetical protein [Bacteroidales bacterium]
MKRIVILMLVAAMALPLTAQELSKKEKDLLKYATKLEKSLENPKKAGTPEPWYKLSQAYFDIYDYPNSDVYQNAQQFEIRMLTKNKQFTTEERTVGDNQFTVDCYEDKDVYYDANGVCQFWLVKKQLVDGALEKSLDALQKSFKLDEFNYKTKKYIETAEKIHTAYHNNGLFYYMAGDKTKAEEFFEKAYHSTENPILNRVDTIALYYTALMARENGKPDKAMELLKRDLEAGYAAKGEVYGNLAEIYREKGDMENYKDILEKGFAAYPENQQILVGLINYNLDTGGDSSKLFDLIHQAQANEPGNASLYYVEGDINKKLGNKEAALELFQKSYDIDNTYLFGIVNKGIMYYEEALEYQDKANALDYNAVKEYDALIEEVNNSLKKAIDPFKQSYQLAEGDLELQVAIAEYLKNIYFRFRNDGDEYMQEYEKYNKIFHDATE